MKVSFIRLDMRVISVMILSVLMVVLSGVGHGAYAQYGPCTEGEVGNCYCIEWQGGIVAVECFSFSPTVYVYMDPSSCTIDCNPTVPTVTTTVITGISAGGASSGGNVTDDGRDTVTVRGVCWGTSENPTISDDCTIDGGGTGTFPSSITGLTSGTEYHVRAYATNNIGTSYGSDLTFTTTTSVTAPEVTTTTEVTSITGTTATSGGNITSTGGADVTASGVCWGTSANPSTDDSADTCTTDGTATGAFTSSLTGLSLGTDYYVRAYAKNSVDTSYGADVTFTTWDVPTVTTAASPINFSQTEASIGINNVSDEGGSPVTEKGLCWGTSQDPDTNGIHEASGKTGTGNFTFTITGLTPGTLYYVRAYAISSVGTGYGADMTFTTQGTTVPILTTASVTTFDTTTATLGGNITDTGGENATARGVCWNTTGTPTITDDKSEETGDFGTGTFTFDVTALTPATEYYVRAYATNVRGTGYGTEVTFTTNSLVPILTTTEVTTFDATTATLGGNITDAGVANPTVRGVCWNTTGTPTTANDKDEETDSFSTGAFTRAVTGLTPGETYHVRAYATNTEGTAYGDEVTFTTTAVQATVPTVTTDAVSSITTTGATGGGNVTSDGGDPVTERGVCWGTSADPTTGDNTVTESPLGTDAAFTSVITGLTAGTAYHVRAYATNSVGTSYGADVPFATADAATAPAVTTAAADPVTQNSATTGGTVTSDGGDPVTERGVCWGTSADPTTGDNTVTESPLGTDAAFTSVITGLTAGTAYHVRAYATNSVGTSYGADVPFATADAATAPAVTTAAADPVTQNSATTGGTVTSDGGDSVTERGVCWGTSADPTTGDNTVPESPLGTDATFTSVITGLTAGTAYHVRAYATNSVGASYGKDVTFKTLPIPGDIDCSGDIDMADLILALEISAGIDTSTETICNADVNGDGKIGVEEVIYILNELLK
ncbi:dockerin type I repeat-containing protein [Desulfobacterales bacterium HSG2]|nr:dockerin type I repeat-containing protein [Desulfobacterales bacterium HSG2]